MSLKNTDVKTPGISTIAKKFNLPVAKVVRLVNIGAKTEFEHNKNLAKAKQVARDHIAERPDYYQKLKKMEKTPVSMNEMDTDLMPYSRNIIDKRNDDKPKDDTVNTRYWNHSSRNDSFVHTPKATDKFGSKTPETSTPKVDTQKGEYGATPEVKGTISTFRGVNRTPLLEENSVSAVRGLGYVSGDPSGSDNPVEQYLTTNAMSYEDYNGNVLQLIRKMHSRYHDRNLGFHDYTPNEIQNELLHTNPNISRRIMKESNLNELSGGDSRDYEGGVSGLPKSAYRYNDIKEGKRLEKAKKLAGGAMVAANLFTLGQVAGDAAEGRGSPKRSIIAAATAKPGIPGLVASGAHYGLKVKDFMRRRNLQEIKATTVGNAQAFAAAKRKELTSKGHLSQDDVKKWWKYERFVKSATDKLSGRTKVPPTIDDKVPSKGKKKETKNG